MGHHRFGAQGRGEAVGHVASDAERIGHGERAWLDAQQVELQRTWAAGLVLVDPFEIVLQRLGGRTVGI